MDDFGALNWSILMVYILANLALGVIIGNVKWREEKDTGSGRMCKHKMSLHIKPRKSELLKL
jgi:hypothetical protein